MINRLDDGDSVEKHIFSLSVHLSDMISSFALLSLLAEHKSSENNFNKCDLVLMSKT